MLNTLLACGVIRHTGIMTIETDLILRGSALNIKGGVTGRLLGAVVFLAGIGLLVWTFQLAFHFYGEPIPSAKSDVAQLGVIGISMVKKIVMLLVMLLAGSLIAGKGIHLYLAGQAPRSIQNQTPDTKK